MKTLQIAEIASGRVGVSDGYRGEHAGGLREVPVHLKRAADNWIETGDGGSNAQSRADQAVGACTHSTRGDAGTAGSRTDHSTEPAHAAAGRVLHDASVHAENISAG